MWRISALDRDGREVGRSELVAGELTIGRDSDRQLILPSASVSRRHARVYLDGGQPCIVDEGSANGVIVDGVRITAADLRQRRHAHRRRRVPSGASSRSTASTATPPPRPARPTPVPRGAECGVDAAADAAGRRGRALRRARLRADGRGVRGRARRRQRRGARRSVAVAQARQALSARRRRARGRGSRLVERHLHQSAQGRPRRRASGRHACASASSAFASKATRSTAPAPCRRTFRATSSCCWPAARRRR